MRERKEAARKAYEEVFESAWKVFRDVVADALRPVHVALGEAPAGFAKHGVTGHTYFNAGKGLLIA